MPLPVSHFSRTVCTSLQVLGYGALLAENTSISNRTVLVARRIWLTSGNITGAKISSVLYRV